MAHNSQFHASGSVSPTCNIAIPLANIPCNWCPCYLSYPRYEVPLVLMVPLVPAVALVLLVLLVPAMSQSVTVSLIPLVDGDLRPITASPFN